ncbi:Calcineurin-like phosphoesterase domain, ApaH type [Dillenia turbinata]|uniref:Calcineurin-like phosphoesterase domain, ApaH type n=1 Tax=Dillenia turbinata TaxID=194707 RepID=A0AAN8V5X1_9MAGN
MGTLILVVLACLSLISQSKCQEIARPNSRKVMELRGSPQSVIWVVQLSDLHFSVHHPDRALDFRTIVGPTLSMINPSLVLITGDLTDGKSKDMLTMKQDKHEWIEYQQVMDDVIRTSRLDKSIFYDLRGNHDNFGVPVVGGSFDFFSQYSISGQLGRRGNVNSVTVQSGDRKHLFVGVDSTMTVGLRGPTNVFGHPTDELLSDLDTELSQWDSLSSEPVTKISFGHFPLSFSAASSSGKSLKDIFLKHSVSAYLCGHLHTKFGKNLKRHHRLGHHLFQLNIHQNLSGSKKNCSSLPVEEFWEWEMGDWRKSRAMRIVAIDHGHVSFADLRFDSGAKKTIIVPTFPLDSRLMFDTASGRDYECQAMNRLAYQTIRALVFSVSPVVSVIARIYDSTSGHHDLVLEAQMIKSNLSSGDLYAAPWNYQAFEDPSPDRYWLQIEATDIMGRASLTELRPFSVNGLSAKLTWTWKEFLVMGCQWDALYYPIFWFCLISMFAVLIIPKVLLTFSKNQYQYKSLIADKSLISFVIWVLKELCKFPVIWFSLLGYLFYLILFPWFYGQVFTEAAERGYMTYKGWLVNLSIQKKVEFIGSPDILMIVLSHLVFVVLSAILTIAGLAAEREAYRVHMLTLSGKKEDDYGHERRCNGRSKFFFGRRLVRKLLLVVCLAIYWKHFKSCRALAKGYEMNPFLHFPIYSLFIPLLLAYAAYKTQRA